MHKHVDIDSGGWNFCEPIYVDELLLIVKKAVQHICIHYLPYPKLPFRVCSNVSECIFIILSAFLYAPLYFLLPVIS
jgi:hypothetical protein